MHLRHESPGYKRIRFGSELEQKIVSALKNPLQVSFLVASSALTSVGRNQALVTTAVVSFVLCFVCPLLGESHDFHAVSNVVSNKPVLR